MYKVNVTQGKMNRTVIVEQEKIEEGEETEQCEGSQRALVAKKFPPGTFPALQREGKDSLRPNQSGEDQVKGTEGSSSLDVQQTWPAQAAPSPEAGQT